jgi:hypothetical protein
LTPINQRADNNEKSAQDEKSGRNDVNEKPEIRIAVRREQVQDQQQHESEQAAEQDDKAT